MHQNQAAFLASENRNEARRLENHIPAASHQKYIQANPEPVLAYVGNAPRPKAAATRHQSTQFFVLMFPCPRCCTPYHTSMRLKDVQDTILRFEFKQYHHARPFAVRHAVHFLNGAKFPGNPHTVRTNSLILTAERCAKFPFLPVL